MTGAISFADALAVAPEVPQHLAAAEDRRTARARRGRRAAGLFVDRALARTAEPGRTVTRRERRRPSRRRGSGGRARPRVRRTRSGARSEMWDPQVPRLAERFRVVIATTSGAWGSPIPPPARTTYRISVTIVLALLDRARCRSGARLVGLSLGGLDAHVGRAQTRPNVSTVWCCVARAATFAPPEPWSGTRGGDGASREGMDAVADVVVGRWFTPASPTGIPASWRRMRDMIACTPPAGYAACCEVVGTDGPAPEPSVRSGLRRSVIGGADDPAVPRERVRGARAAVSRTPDSTVRARRAPRERRAARARHRSDRRAPGHGEMEARDHDERPDLREGDADPSRGAGRRARGRRRRPHDAVHRGLPGVPDAGGLG